MSKGWVKRFMVCMTALFILCGCSRSGVIEDASTVDTTYKVYYLKSDISGIEGLSWNYNGQTAADLVEECVSVLRQNPESSHYVSPLIEDLSILRYEWNEERSQVNLYFNDAYSQLEKSREVLIRAAIVKTLTQFDNIIDYVQFYVDGQVLKDSKGRIMTMMSSDFVESTSADVKNLSASTIKLYFASSDGQQLAEEDIYVHYQNTATMETVVVESLIAGPLSNTLNRTIADDTMLNSATVTDGTCYVDVNSRFLDTVDNQSFQVKVYSLVNSLCALESVNRVQILIDGQVSDYSDEDIHIDEPLEADTSMVVKAVDTPPAVEQSESGE